MDHLNNSEATRKSFKAFFLDTIMKTPGISSECELAGITHLMDIVNEPTEEEVSEQLSAVAYSGNQWKKVEEVYSRAVSTTNETDIISRMVQLRKV